MGRLRYFETGFQADRLRHHLCSAGPAGGYLRWYQDGAGGEV